MEAVDTDQQSSLILAEDGISFDSERPTSADSDGSEVLLSNGEGAPNRYIWALTFAAGVSGLLFGYE